MELRNQLQKILHLHDSLDSCLQIQTNLVHHILETQNTKCQDVQCKGTIKRVFRPEDDRKGSVCVIYDNILGPKIGISYKSHCSKCTAIYYHGYFTTKSNDTYYENISSIQFYQLSDSTFFNFNIFEEYKMLRFGNGVSCASFCDIYNKRFANQIKCLKRIVKNGDGCMGHRTDGTLELEPNRLQEAFHLFGLQILINDDLQHTFIVKNTLKQSLKLQKQQKIIVKPKKQDDMSLKLDSTMDNSQSECKKNAQVTTVDLINGLYNDYAPQLNKIEPLCVKQVPVKNGIVMHGAFGVYGDGNQTKQRKKCMYPKTLSKLEQKLQNKLSQIDEYNCNLLVCPNYPQKGNRYAISFLTCESHTTKLVNLGMDCYKLNAYILYMSIMEQMATCDAKKSPTRYKSLQNQLNDIPTDDVMFFNQFTNKLQTQSNTARRSTRITDVTRSNLQQSVRSDNNSFVKIHLFNVALANHMFVLMCFVHSVENIIDTEREDDEFFDQLQACRKGKNATKPAAGYTGGVNVWCTCNGFIIKMKENVCRETPTEIIADTHEIFTSTPRFLLFWSLMTIMGWDMICCIVKRLQTLVKENILSPDQLAFYSIGFVSIFVADLWHISTHTCKYCVLDSTTCLFHPMLPKFKQSLFDKSGNKMNLNIAEHQWVPFNKMQFMKQLCRELYELNLLLYRKYHNSRRKEELVRQGFDFKPLEEFSNSKRRSYQLNDANGITLTMQNLVKHAQADINLETNVSNTDTTTPPTIPIEVPPVGGGAGVDTLLQSINIDSNTNS